MARKKGLTFYEKKKKISKAMIREIFSTLFYVFAAILLAFVIVFSVGMKTSVIGVSMEPILSNGQEVLINRFIYPLTTPHPETSSAPKPFSATMENDGSGSTYA